MKTYCFVFCFAIGWSRPAFADCAKSLEDSVIHLYPARATISGVGSRPVLRWMIKGFKKYLHLAEDGRSDIARIYRAISPQLQDLISRAAALEVAPELNQDEVFKIAYAFVNVVDFATHFVNRVGYYADGFDLARRFGTRTYFERRKDFVERFGVDPLLTNVLPHLARSRVWDWQHPTKDLRFTKYLVAGMYDQKPNLQNYFFQYKYVPTNHELSMRRLFQDRERGLAYYGVSQRPFSPADGQFLNANLYMDHDLFHAFMMKVRDLALFRTLGVSTADAARDVKTINHELLQKRLAEWDDLRANESRHVAIEVLLFALMHEQAMTYPIGVNDDLLARSSFYTQAITHALGSDRLGARAKRLMKGREAELIHEAIGWVRVRAAADRAEFDRRFVRRLPSPKAPSPNARPN